MPTLIRPMDGSREDYARFCAIYRAAELSGVADVDQRISRDARRRDLGRAVDYWLAERQGQVIGVGTAFAMLRYDNPALRFAEIGVLPDHERQGVATALWATMASDLEAAEVSEVMSVAWDHKEGALPFAHGQGFEDLEGEVELALRIDLTDLNLDPLQPHVDRVTDAGLRLAPLSELQGEFDDWLERVYTLWTTCDAQIPTTLTHNQPTIEAFRTTELEGPNALDGGWFIALEGDDWVGVSELRINASAPWPIFPGLTGVLPSHQGKGVATALKVLGLRWSQSAGHHRHETRNLEGNVAMLAINERLGFQRCGTWRTLRRRLSPA